MGNRGTRQPGRWAGGIVAGLAIVAMLAWIAASVFDWSPGRRPGSVPAGTRLGEVAAADKDSLYDLRPALLVDYYEHQIEHAPPRDPSGVMQRRELNYRAPLDPLRLLRSKLTTGPADMALRHELDAWEADWRKGLATQLAQFDPIGRLALSCSVDSGILVEAGRGFNYLEGDAFAAVWYKAGLSKAQVEFKSVTPDDPRAQALVHSIEQTKALWRLSGYNELRQRFLLEKALNAPLSAASRRAGYLSAEMSYHCQLYGEAADLILSVCALDREIGDLGLQDRSDIHEMDWVQGLFLYSAKRYGEAIPHLESASAPGQQHAHAALELLAFALSRSDKTDEARKALSRLSTEVPDSRFISAISAEVAAREHGTGE